MTDLQWAIIATIHNEPKYRFVEDEHTAATRMATRGWLRRSYGKTFAVTRRGEEAYAARSANGSRR